MTANPFAALIAGVPRFEIVAHEWDTYDCQDGDYVRYSEVLAALAAAVPDDLAEAGKVAEECIAAVNGEGNREYDWGDKPHRLVYDLARTITAILARIAAQEVQIKGLEAERDHFELERHKHQRRAMAAETALAASEAKVAKLVEDNQGLRDQIEKLLKITDDMDKEVNGEDGPSMHCYGQTPDWYVEAAFWSCYGYGPNDARAAITEAGQ